MQYVEREICLSLRIRERQPCALAKMTGVTRVHGRFITLKLKILKDLLEDS